MEPAYHNGQFVLLNKWDRDFAAGDVVAFYSAGLKAVLVKRIAACPGDRIVIRGGRMMVNEEPSPVYADTFFADGGRLAQELVLDADEYVMIGDNIAQSRDSRDDQVGVVARKEIRGKVMPYKAYGQ